MIRSIKHHYRSYTNTGKILVLESFLVAYQEAVQHYIDYLWSTTLYYQDSQDVRWNIEQDKLHAPAFLNYTASLPTATKLSARALSAAATQALGIVKGRVAIRKKLLFVIQKRQDEGLPFHHLTEKLARKQCDLSASPTLNENFSAELSSKNISFVERNGYFALFIRLGSTGFSNIHLPIKLHRQDRKWLSAGGELLTGILVSSRNIQLRYDVPEPAKKTTGKIVGADTGILSVITFSDKQETKSCPHGHDLDSITDKLARKKKGSRAFQRAEDHRFNFVNWTINRLDLEEIKQINLEQINTFCGSKRSRKLSHFAHSLISDKLMRIAQERGVLVLERPCIYKYQRCSGCGMVRKANRKGKIYSCKNCNLIIDADLNSAINNSIDLPAIPYWIRCQELNQAGFWWKPEGLFDLDNQEIRVPDAEQSESISLQYTN